MIKQLITACIIGTLITLYHAQHDPWIQQHVAHAVCNQMSTALACTITHDEVEELRIFGGSITLRTLHVSSNNPQQEPWSWHADSFRLSFSWLDLLLYGTLDLTVAMHNLAAESAFYEEYPAITAHIQTMIAGPPLAVPIILKEITLHKASFKGHDRDGSLRCSLDYAGQFKKIHNALKANIRIADGEYHHKKRTIYTHLYGSVQLSASNIETNPATTVSSNCTLTIPALNHPQHECHLSGRWHTNKGVMRIKNNNNSFEIVAKAHNGNIIVSAHAPMQSINKLLYDTDSATLHGSCQLHARGNLHKKLIKGHVLFKEIATPHFTIGSLAQITFEKTQDRWRGSLYGQRKSGVACDGTWEFNAHDGCGTVQLSNSTALSVHPSSQWRVPAHHCTFACSFDQQGALTGNFLCTAQHAKLHTTMQATTHIVHADGRVTCNGSIGNNTYDAAIQLHPSIYLEHCAYHDAQQKPLITLTKQEDTNNLQGTVHFGCIREALNNLYAYDLQGEGRFETTITRHNTAIGATINLVDGNIRLPQTYNFINGFSVQALLDWHNKRITFDDLCCQLHKGTIHSKRAALHYTDDGSITFATAPLIMHDCLLNIQKDLFANVSSRLVFAKRANSIPFIKGTIILDRSQLNENLFSQSVQQSLMRNAKNMFTQPASTDIALDITIASSNPVRVQTTFLETEAQVRLALSNTVQQPVITGSVQLHAGELNFPYKPLYITKGTIYFLPNQLYDPMIELEARNTIKKCTVTMHVTGSVQNHHIQLSSTPSLSEEQIMALLLVGSQEESLNIVMPALIMQNVKQLLFGSEQKQNGLERYFTGFLKPLKHITLVPSFADQTGRGGLRAAVEINVHDKVRAVIQKNFTLTEDTRFELEYMLSDDISLKGVRDERRDLSGELEMKWKF